MQSFVNVWQPWQRSIAKERQDDFRKAKEKVLYRKSDGVPEGLYL